jgi:protein ImuA
MFPASSLSQPCQPLPAPIDALEDMVAAGPSDRAASLAFALARCRMALPVMAILPRRALHEAGWPSLHGLAAWRQGMRLLLVTPRTDAEALWAMEQGLKSGALGGVIAAVDGATMTQTRRLDFAARDGGTPGVLLGTRSLGLSSARRRWQVAALPSAMHDADNLAPGAPRLLARLLRARDGPPHEWVLEYDATAGLVVAGELAADGAATPLRRAA